MVSRTRKILAFSAIGILALAVTAVFTLDLGFIREPLGKIVSEALEREFTIDGPLTIRIGKAIHIEASNVRLGPEDALSPDPKVDAGAESPVQHDMLRIGSFELTLPLKALFSRPIIIDTLRINDTNLRTTAADSDTSSDAERNAHNETDLAGQPTHLPVFVRNLQITNVHWRHDDPARTEPWLVTFSSIDQQLEGDNVILTTSGEINKTPMRLKLSAQPLNELLELETVEFEANGQLGEIAFNGKARFTDLMQPHKPELSVHMTGPSFEYLTDRLGVQEISRGPLAFDVSVTPLLDKMQFSVDGQFGELLVISTGNFDSLQTLNDASLSLSATGPSAQHLRFLPRLSQLPDAPFGTDITLNKVGHQLIIDTSRLTVGRLQITAEGEIPDIRAPSQANIKASLKLPDIGLLSNLLDLPPALTGPASAEFRINTESRATSPIDTAAVGTRFDAQLTTDYGQLAAQGTLSAAQDLTGSTLHVAFDAATPNTLATALGADLPHIEPLRVQTQVHIKPKTLTLSDGKLSVGSHTGTFTGDIHLGANSSTLASDLRADLLIALKGDDLATSLRLLEAPAELHQSFSLNTALTMTLDQLQLRDFNGKIGTSTLAGMLDVDLNSGQLATNVSGHTTNVLGWASLKALGNSTTQIPLDFTAAADWNTGLLTLNTFTIESSAVTASASGTFRGLPHFDGSDLKLTLDVSDLSTLSPLVNQALPAQALHLTAAATGSPTSLEFHTFQLTSGDSDLTGSASISQPQHPNIELALASKRLDLRPFLTPPANEPAAAEPKTAEKTAATPIKSAPIAKGKKQKKKKKKKKLLIPNMPIEVSYLQQFDADIDLQIEALHYGSRLFSDIKLAAQVADGNLVVNQAMLTDEQDGTLLASGSLTNKDDEHQFVARLQGRDINIGLSAQSEEQVAMLPRYQVQLAAISHGNTIREMLAQSDGFFRIEAGKGRYPSGNIQLLTNSFIDELLNKLNPIGKREPYIDVNCIVAIGKLEQGHLSGDPLIVMDGKRLNIFSSAKLNLSTEKIAVTFKTVPQKGLGLSVGNLVNPFVGVGGTLAQPYLTLNPEQSLVTGGAAMATGGLSFLATSLFDRFLREAHPCQATLKKVDQEFTDLAEKYGVEKPI